MWDCAVNWPKTNSELLWTSVLSLSHYLFSVIAYRVLSILLCYLNFIIFNNRDLSAHAEILFSVWVLSVTVKKPVIWRPAF